MRILLSMQGKRELLSLFKKEHCCNSLKHLAKKLKIPLRTLQNWIYIEERYIPSDFVPPNLTKYRLDEKKDNWGSVKGGKKTYQIILKKYGKKEITRRQSLGGKRTIDKIRKIILSPIPKISNVLFLEFYGVLLGDGWIGEYKHKNKIIRMIGISGHSNLDRNFFGYLKRNIADLFNRRAYLKEKPNSNGIELQFSHLKLFNFLSNDLNFPIGKKINLEINKEIFDFGFKKTSHVIRGIFDTDGSFYYDKTPSGNPYPCISIQMKSPLLIKQINDILIKAGFKVTYRKNKCMITLKGSKQLRKWMEQIGSSNKKHLDKMPG